MSRLPQSTGADARRRRLGEMLSAGVVVHALEVHDAISAIIAENARASTAALIPRFDAFWSSSLTDSTTRGLPDIEVLDVRSRLGTIDDVFAVTSTPLIMDGDTGGRPEHFAFAVREMERRGVSAVVIEDKRGLKQNSLLPGEGRHELAGVAEFCEKIRRGREARVTAEFGVFARIEGLIVGLETAEALDRADAYVEAGADGIMIHTRERRPDQILDFARRFRASHPLVPLISVPTTYSDTYARDLAAAGFTIVIYANHMLRAALKAMREVSRTILEHGRSAEAEPLCLTVDEVLRMGQ